MAIDLSRVAVLGDGITGKAVVDYLASQGRNSVSPHDAEILVVSPGIPPSQFPNTTALVMSEIEFAYRLFQALPTPPKIIAVTGTNGKSTVTAMIGHILNAPVSGNIGVPFVSCINDAPPTIVVEVSSYQLETVSQFRPDVAIITNITPDHLERHKTMDNYAQAKANIAIRQTNNDVLIINNQDAFIDGILPRCHGRQCRIGVDSDLTDRIAIHAAEAQSRGFARGLIGIHNHVNGAMAVAAATAAGLNEDDAIRRLLTYEPLPHRMEWVATIQGRQFFNDSKATNPDSTRVAMRSFGQPVHLILGGKDKGLDIHDFIIEVTQRVASVTYFGEIADRIGTTLRDVSCTIPMTQTNTLEDATLSVFNRSLPGSVILFSPACSSFDQFRDFNHRGDCFKDYVSRIARSNPS